MGIIYILKYIVIDGVESLVFWGELKFRLDYRKNFYGKFFERKYSDLLIVVYFKFKGNVVFMKKD